MKYGTRGPFACILVTLRCLIFTWASVVMAAEALIVDRTHPSQVFSETRNYRIFLPPDYGTSGKRYPVIYWFHGFSERYNQPVAGAKDRNYDSGKDYFGDNIANYVGGHDVIVVKWDGYNPRTPGEKYPRPYNISPVETDRQFPFYFQELVQYIDANFRTIADREHRGTAGLSMGGFMSFWIAGKFPHLVSSASNFMGSTEFYVGPRGFEVEYRHEEMRDNYEGVRTRLVIGSRDFIQFYHRQMNAIWSYTRPRHETEEYDFDHGTPGMARTLDFHMNSFANPLPRPAVWSHNDVYPSFSVWGWDVSSDRKQPGFTVLKNVSSTGFQSCVREWLPGGRVIPRVKLWIGSDRLYRPNQRLVVTTIRLRDGQVRRTPQLADAEGRLQISLDGEEYEVGISAGTAVLTLAGSEIDGANWATAGKPVQMRVRFYNKGAGFLTPTTLRWESPNPGVRLEPVSTALPGLVPGQTLQVRITVTVKDEAREIVKLFAVDRAVRLPLEILLYPPAPAVSNFRIADGKAVSVFQHALDKQNLLLGEGNGDGRANVGERIAILLPDGDAFRAAELFTSDRCIDNSTRVSDDWSSYDHVGASAKYSLPLIKAGCQPGHVARMLARVLLPNKPNHRVQYATIEFPISAVLKRPPASLPPKTKLPVTPPASGQK